MFLNYKIIDNVLYLYVDDRCEIGSFYSDKKYFLIDKIKKYIKDMNINFNGTKIVLIISGLMLGTVYLNNDILKKENYNIYNGNKYVYNIVDKTYPLANKSVEEKIEDVVNKSYNNDKNNNIIKENTSIKKDNNIKDALSSNTNEKEVKKEENMAISSNDILINLNRSDGQLVQIALEDYLIGVVAAEMPASFNLEALKAQAVVARTYTLKLLEQKRNITDDISTQYYKSNSELQKIWKDSYNVYYNKIKTAVSSTKNVVIKYDGNLIDAVYHSTSNGYTEDSVNVWGNFIPYLKSVTSPWDTSASSFLKETDILFLELSNKLGIDFNSDTIIEIVSKDESNRVLKIKVGQSEYTGVKLRTLLNLRSTDFDVSINDNSVTFTTRGYGHGVGMSQYGANSMAKAGYTYDQIIKYYYLGVNLDSI